MNDSITRQRESGQSGALRVLRLDGQGSVGDGKTVAIPVTYCEFTDPKGVSHTDAAEPSRKPVPHRAIYCLIWAFVLKRF